MYGLCLDRSDCLRSPRPGRAAGSAAQHRRRRRSVCRAGGASAPAVRGDDAQQGGLQRHEGVQPLRAAGAAVQLSRQWAERRHARLRARRGGRRPRRTGLSGDEVREADPVRGIFLRLLHRAARHVRRSTSRGDRGPGPAGAGGGTGLHVRVSGRVHGAQAFHLRRSRRVLPVRCAAAGGGNLTRALGVHHRAGGGSFLCRHTGQPGAEAGTDAGASAGLADPEVRADRRSRTGAAVRAKSRFLSFASE